MTWMRKRGRRPRPGRRAPVWSRGAVLFAVVVAVAAAGCASGNEHEVSDGPGPAGERAVSDASRDWYAWPDLGPGPDGFVWPDGLPDLPPEVDGAADARPLEGGAPDGGPPDGTVSCPDPYEPNASCSTAKALGTIQESTSWTSKTATLDTTWDADWYTVDAEEGSHTCFPFTNQTYYFKVRVSVPPGRNLRVCVLKESCLATTTCADNATVPGPVQLNVQYKVSGTCALNDDTTAKVMVEQLDKAGGCQPYTLSLNYDD